MHKRESETDAKKIVISFQESLNNRDLKSARSYVSDNFLCTNPLGTFNSAETYFKLQNKHNMYTRNLIDLTLRRSSWMETTSAFSMTSLRDL